jgi:hypothetical protein
MYSKHLHSYWNGVLMSPIRPLYTYFNIDKFSLSDQLEERTVEIHFNQFFYSEGRRIFLRGKLIVQGAKNLKSRVGAKDLWVGTTPPPVE